MHCHCGTNNRAPRWTFTDPCKPEVRPGAREESASPAWLAAPAMNARDTTKVYIWRLDTGCGPTLYKKCHSHNTPGKRHNNTWVEPLAGNCTTSSTRQREQVWQKCKNVIKSKMARTKIWKNCFVKRINYLRHVIAKEPCICHREFPLRPPKSKEISVKKQIQRVGTVLEEKLEFFY